METEQGKVSWEVHNRLGPMPLFLAWVKGLPGEAFEGLASSPWASRGRSVLPQSHGLIRMTPMRSAQAQPPWSGNAILLSRNHGASLKLY